MLVLSKYKAFSLLAAVARWRGGYLILFGTIDFGLMFENVKKGWKTASAVRKLVFKDKELFVYPILSVIVVILEAVIVFGTLIFAVAPAGGGLNTVTFIVALFIFYVLVYFTGTYFIMAMLIAFRSFAGGKKIGFGDAFGQTAPYAGLILEWALFYSVLVMILRAVESRLKGIGRILVGSLGALAISTATLFAIPIILDKKVGPIKAVEGSISFIKDNFGSTFGGLIYADLYGMLISLIGIVILVAGVLLLMSSGGQGYIPATAWIALGAGAIGLMVIVIGSLVSSVTMNAYKLILYDHFNGGKMPAGFTEDMFQTKKKNPSGGIMGKMGGGFVQ
jgi:hypothetical protein